MQVEVGDCCHVTGMCGGNTVESENVVCSNGVLKEYKNNITSDNSEDDCCDHKIVVVIK